MNSKDREALLDKLIDLMSLHRHDSYDMRGLPYVNDDGSFGLTAGQKNGGLYAAYHLLDRLQEGGLLSGGKPGTDLDTAVYTLRQGMVFEVYDGTKLFRSDDENEITVQIGARPVADVMAALDKGIEAVNAEHRASAKSEMKYRAERIADKAREKLAPVAGMAADNSLVRAYLKLRIEDLFPHSDVQIKRETFTPEQEKILNDPRPRHSVTFNHPAGENYTRFNDFHNRLGDVFNGSCAVMPHQGSRDDVRNGITVTGNIPRLAADLLENDSKGARRALGMIEDELTTEQLNVYKAYIERFDATKNEMTSLTQGTVQPIKVGGTLKIKAQP